jgi:hypothetical protein
VAKPRSSNEARRPYPAHTNIFFVESAGTSRFDSLQVMFDRPLTRRLSLLAVYTLGKSIDDASAFLGTPADKNLPQDSRNPRAERGPSSFDVRHRFTTSFIIASFDLSASRMFQGVGGTSVRIGIQAFNLFNRSNFNLPEPFADEPSTFLTGAFSAALARVREAAADLAASFGTAQGISIANAATYGLPTEQESCLGSQNGWNGRIPSSN